MIKKLIVICISLFSLFECKEDQKVTTDMLVDQWECKFIDFLQKFYKDDKLNILKSFSNLDESQKSRGFTYKTEDVY
ncbi:hypothetical protein [Gilliamella sp. A7]|uniref:hypothetical protein n=1 Tax=Gilliamella sp. A7 TaxID=1970465 RepID=UPI000A349057|nr:hypothetical protein [Gilliamella sp. A7]OTQ56654.1 hypothetical protein B6D18_11385 [Gilliamella sp. A7]